MVGEITQPHIRPWSTVFRIPTDSGIVWCKANRPGSAHEIPLLEAFGRWDVRGAMLPMAVDTERRLMLLPDGGTTLRASGPDGTGDHDLGAWAGVLEGYAALQRSLEIDPGRLLALGVPDGRPGSLVGTVERLVADDRIWVRADPEDRDSAEAARQRLPGLIPSIVGLVGILVASGIPATIQHDDLHGANILMTPDGPRIFDWGDAIVAHPFGTLTATMNSIAYHAGFDQDGPELTGLRARYLASWSDLHSPSELAVIARAATLLGAVARATSWERALTGLTVKEMEGHGGGTAGWLVELVERLDRSAAAGGAT